MTPLLDYVTGWSSRQTSYELSHKLCTHKLYLPLHLTEKRVLRDVKAELNVLLSSLSCLLFSHPKNLCISNAAVHKLSDPTERERERASSSCSLIPPFPLFLPHSHPTAAPPTRTQSRCIFFHLSRLHPLHHSASFLALSFSAPSWIFFFSFV